MPKQDSFSKMRLLSLLEDAVSFESYDVVEGTGELLTMNISNKSKKRLKRRLARLNKNIDILDNMRLKTVDIKTRRSQIKRVKKNLLRLENTIFLVKIRNQ